MIDDYGYITARIRAMRTRLLPKTFFDRLLRESNLGDIITALDSTEYAQSVTEARTSNASDIIAVETGIAQHLRAVYAKILGMTGGAPRRLLGVILKRWDLFNLKTVIRAKWAGVSWTEAQKNLLPVYELSEPLLKELMKQPDVKAVVDLLVTWHSTYYRPLLTTVADLTKTGNLALMETALDREYYTSALSDLNDEPEGSENAQIVRDFLRTEIDLVNIITLARLIGQKVPALERGSFFIRGGKEITGSYYATLSTVTTVNDMLEKLTTTRYGKVMQEAGITPDAALSVSSLEQIFQAYLGRYAAGFFARYPVSIGPVIGYLWLKLLETTNLRMICRGKAVDLPTSLIQEALIFV